MDHHCEVGVEHHEDAPPERVLILDVNLKLVAISYVTSYWIQINRETPNSHCLFTQPNASNSARAQNIKYSYEFVLTLYKDDFQERLI